MPLAAFSGLPEVVSEPACTPDTRIVGRDRHLERPSSDIEESRSWQREVPCRVLVLGSSPTLRTVPQPPSFL